MTHTKLDDILKSFCSEVGDSWLHRYSEFYLSVYNWFSEVKDQRLGGVQATMRIPVTDQRIWVPPNLSVGKVGVNVNGSISVLLPNENMLDLTDDCGVYVPPRSGNPDAPAYNYGSQDVRIGPTGWWNGYGTNATTFSQAYSWFVLPQYWPGQGGGKSIRGYYRHFKDKGYILVDASFRGHEIILEGMVPTFVSGVQTWVRSETREAMKAYCLFRASFLAMQVNPSKFRVMLANQPDYIRAMQNLRSALNTEPLAVIVAAVQSRLGQLGPF